MEKVKLLRRNIVIFIIAIIAIIVTSIIIRYSVEGETNLPFIVSKIMIISNAGGIQQDSMESKWNLNLIQNNDIYIDIIKNKNYGKKEIIYKITIDNFKIEDEPQKGKVQIYRPDDPNFGFTNKEEYKIENEIQYIGSKKSNLNNLEIANQGGLIILRYTNQNLGNYKTDDEEIIHDGTLLNKIGITNEEIQFKVSFDISIELNSGKKYKANVDLQMPVGNLVQEGTTNSQINGNEIIFKRY